MNVACRKVHVTRNGQHLVDRDRLAFEQRMTVSVGDHLGAVVGEVGVFPGTKKNIFALLRRDRLPP